MAEENAGESDDLKQARADLRDARADRDRLKGELTTLRGEMTRTKTALETEIETLKTTHAGEMERVRIDLTGRATAAEEAATQAKASAQERVMMSDLRAAAKEAGLRDMDGIKLLDLKAAKLDDDGNLTNGAEIMAAMKEAKPYFFGSAAGVTTGTTSSTAAPPAPGKPATFNARTASAEEVRAQQAILTGNARPPGQVVN